jgi:hypothetical protein
MASANAYIYRVPHFFGVSGVTSLDASACIVVCELDVRCADRRAVILDSRGGHNLNIGKWQVMPEITCQWVRQQPMNGDNQKRQELRLRNKLQRS